MKIKSALAFFVPAQAAMLRWIVFAASLVGLVGGMRAESLPPEWGASDIGAAGASGSVAFDVSSGAFTTQGAGADIWDRADAFHYVYQPLTADGGIVARVASVANTNAWAKAGVMIRETLEPGSRHASMFVTPSSGLSFQYRAATDGTMTHATVAGAAPRWVKIVRRSQVIEAFHSADGSNWILAQRMPLAMGPTAYVGLAVCSHVAGTLTTAVFDHVELSITTPGLALPWPWEETSVGAATEPGVALFDGSYVLANAGTDIWSAADRLKFVSRPLEGDGVLTIKAAANTSGHEWSRFGLAMRETTDAGAKSVTLVATPRHGVVFQSRRDTGGETAFRSNGVSARLPLWLRLARAGNTFTASTSADGVTWIECGVETVSMASSIQVGAVYSNPAAALAMGVGDSLALVSPADADGNGLPDAWELRHFSQTGQNPQADPDGDGLATAQELLLGTNPGAYTPYGQRPALEVVGPTSQTGASGTELSAAVRVVDATTGVEVPGVAVSFDRTGGQGLVNAVGAGPVVVVSDAEGIARCTVRLPSTSGVTLVRASIGYGSQIQAQNLSFTSLLGGDASSSLLTYAAIGSVTAAGQASYADGVFTLATNTGDIWGRADSFGFAHAVFEGEGVLVARVASLSASDGWAKAGLMLRESLAAGSAHVSIVATPGNGVAFQWRDTTGGTSGTVNRIGLAAPVWLALRRAAGVVYGYYSADGRAWTLLGNRALSPAVVRGGLAFSTHGGGAGVACFDFVRSAPLAPSPWKVADVGLLRAGSIDEFSEGAWLIRGGGGDVWSNADNFRFVYQTLPAGGRVVVRMLSQANTSPSAKAGVMIRESLAPGARNANLSVMPGWGVVLQDRPLTAGPSRVVASRSERRPPAWLKLERFGSRVDAYVSSDGLAWTTVGSSDIGFGGEALVGVISCSNQATTAADSLFDNVRLERFAAPAGASQTVASVPGRSGVATSGTWIVSGDSIEARSLRGSVEYTVSLPAAGIFRLDLNAIDVYAANPTRTFELELKVDGKTIGSLFIEASGTSVGLGRIYLPWLPAGEHRIEVVWHNGRPDSFLRILDLALIAPATADADADGVADWSEEYVAATFELDEVAVETHVSPFTVEGGSIFPAFVKASVSYPGLDPATTALAIEVGLTHRWFAHVPLRAEASAFVVASDSGGWGTRHKSVTWTPFNLLAASAGQTPLLLREGDTLLVSANVDGDTGATDVTVVSPGGASEVHSLQADARFPLSFATAGDYQLWTTRAGGTPALAATVQVRRVRLAPAPLLMETGVREWIPFVLPVEATLEHDASLRLDESMPKVSPRLFALSAFARGPGRIIARLGKNGPVAAAIGITPLRSYNAEKGKWDVVQVFADGTQLWKGVLDLGGPVPPGLRISINVFKAGTTFDDGTITRTFTAADFDENGVAVYYLLRTPGTVGAPCHTVRFYDGATYLNHSY